MNMFKVKAMPKTLAQTPIRLCQVNNISAQVSGAPPLNRS